MASPCSTLGRTNDVHLADLCRRDARRSQIKHLQSECEDLDRQVEELSKKCEAIERHEAERRALDEKKHQEEVSHLKKLNEQLKQNLENLLSIPKK